MNNKTPTDLQQIAKEIVVNLIEKELSVSQNLSVIGTLFITGCMSAEISQEKALEVLKLEWDNLYPKESNVKI